MKDRIKKIMESEGMTPARFADSIGLQRSVLSHILSGRNNPSLDVLMKVITRFDYLSTDWVLFGKEPMFKHQIKTDSSNPEESQTSLFDNSDLAIIDFAEEAKQTYKEVAPQPIKPTAKEPVLKEVVMNEKPSNKIVSRIVVFYNDNTFENFIPESSVKK